MLKKVLLYAVVILVLLGLFHVGFQFFEANFDDFWHFANTFDF